MSNANKRKGDRTELEAVTYLQERFGRSAFRPHQEGYTDVGDIHLSPFVIQAKNWADLASALREGLAGALKQAIAAGEPFGVAWIKRRGKGAAGAYVVMDGQTFRDVVDRLRRAESLLARHAPEVFHTEHLPTEQTEDASQTSSTPDPETEPEPESE